MISYGRQAITDEDIAAVVDALRGDFLTTGPLVELFENEISKIVGAPAISVSSGTAALHCAYAAIGIESGDEVITPPLTFIATQATAALMGAKIVFADIQEDTGNIDPKAVEAAITSKTKAIVAVDYAGHPADLDELRVIADKYGVYLIEDAAHSIGSTYKGRPVGSIADLTTFSFFPTKNITTAEGGAVASIHPELLLKAKRFSRQGLVKNSDEFLIDGEGSWHQEVHQFGLNYRLPDVLCALGISQLKKIELFKKQRKDIFTNYKSLMKGSSSIQLPIQRSYVDPMWHLYPIRVSASNRKYVFDLLRENGIGVQVNYMPANLHPVFTEKTGNNSSLKNSVNYYKEQISLPMHTKLTVIDQDYISETLLRIVSSLK